MESMSSSQLSSGGNYGVWTSLSLGSANMFSSPVRHPGAWVFRGVRYLNLILLSQTLLSPDNSFSHLILGVLPRDVSPSY